jgi:hypothetical protein
LTLGVITGEALPLPLEQSLSRMTEKYSWYKAALRRKKIEEAKRLKAARYVDEMNKRANDKSTTSNTQ